MNPLKKMKLAGLLKKQSKHNAARESGQAVALETELKTLLELAHFYDGQSDNKELPFAREQAFEALRFAAALGAADAQYECGKRRLELGKFWLSQYASEVSAEIHTRYANDMFNEAFTFLTQAKNSQHPLALRLHGMAYVHGWGVPQDTNKGYEMVIESITWENAWDRATKIFEELGLNSPEFFTALSAKRQK